MGKYKGRKAPPTTGWSKAASDPLAPQDVSSPRIKVGKHIKAPSYKYAGVDPAEPSSTDDERLSHSLTGSPQRVNFNPFDVLADAGEDVGLMSETDSSDAYSATEDLQDTARPSGPVAGAPSQSLLHAGTPMTVDSTAADSLASQTVTGSLPEDNPAWLQLLADDETFTLEDDDDAPSAHSAAATARIPEPSATEATKVEKAPATAALNSSTETERPCMEASAPVACTEAVVSKPSTTPPPFVPVLPRYEAAPHVVFVATEALAELPQYEAMVDQPPMNLMQEAASTTKVEGRAPRNGASERQVVGTRTPVSNADQETSGEASILAQPAVNSTAPTTLQTTTVAGAPGMPESLSHLSEGPLPSIDERNELFTPEKLLCPAPLSSHPAPSSSRVGKIIGVGWEYGWDVAYSCAGIAVGGYLGWRAGWSKPLSKPL